MTTMPAEITYGHVTGRFIAAWTDGPDAGRLPDPRPLEGLTIKITPKVQTRRLAGAAPVLVATMPVTCKVDADGRLIDEQDTPGVWLVTGVYGVTYSHPAVTIPAHDIEVTAAHTEAAPLYLSLAVPPGGPILTPSQYAELSARIDALGTGGGDTPQTLSLSGAELTLSGGGGSVTLPSGGGGGSPETMIATSTYTVTASGDYLAQIATTVTLPDGNTRGLDVGQYVCVRQIGSDWYISETGTLLTAPDITLPTAGTLSVSTASTTADLLVSGAMDNNALHGSPYRFSRDGGATWTAWQAAATYTYSALTQGSTHTFVHEVRDASGNVKRGASVTASTPSSLTWSTLYADTPTKADGTAMATGLALDTTQGGRTWTKISANGPTAQGGWWTGPGSNTMFRVENTPTPGGYLYRMSAQYDITTDQRSTVGIAFETSNGSHGVSVSPMKTDVTRFQVLKPPIETFTVVEITPVPASVPLTGTIAVEWSSGTRTFDAYLNGVRHFTATRNAGPAAATTAHLTVNVSWPGAKARDIKVEVYS